MSLGKLTLEAGRRTGTISFLWKLRLLNMPAILILIMLSWGPRAAHAHLEGLERRQTAQSADMQRATHLRDESERLNREGNYGEAIPLAERALTIFERELGPVHPEVAVAANNLALLYLRIGEYDRVEPLLLRVLRIVEKELGPAHPGAASVLNNLAELYQTTGDYEKGEPLFVRALAIREKTLGPNHLQVALSLNNLAGLYMQKGDYAMAEPIYRRALTIREQALGPDHPEVAQSLSNIAVLYESKGDQKGAEPLYQRALAIDEKRLGPERIEVAMDLNNLGLLYLNRNDHARAEPLLSRSLDIREKVLGPDHASTANAVNSLALLYQTIGDHGRAELLYHRALQIVERALGSSHRNVAAALLNLGSMYKTRGDYAKAEPFFLRALEIQERVLGANHPDTGDSLSSLAELNHARGQYTNAITYQARANQVRETNIELNVASCSEQQRLLYLATLVTETYRTISLHMQSAPNDAVARRLALLTVLQRKGRALDATVDGIGNLRRNLDDKDRAVLDELTVARTRLSTLVLGGPRDRPPSQHQAEIRTAEELSEKLEAQISSRSARFRAHRVAVSVDAVQALIPADGALIEFVSYRPYNATYKDIKESFGEPRYAAFVLGNQGHPGSVDLGEAGVIHAAVTALREALRDPRRNDVKQLARALDERVMRPVRQLLGGKRKLLLSPDGSLNLIPFSALVDEQDQYLVKQYSFTYLTSGRDLLRLREKTESRGGAVIIADPDFGQKSASGSDRGLKVKTTATSTPEGSSANTVNFADIYFGPLPGTEGEAQGIKSILPSADLLTKKQATEAAIKRVAGPSILHVATHGYFLEDVIVSSSPSINRGLLVKPTKQSGAGSPNLSELRVQNPLLRSGLAMAGANGSDGGNGDGVLTALEASGLDLWGTKLVVLSACDTGVGEIRNGEGVYGLRRAFVLAGSESQVLSLWPVSDEATRDLMIQFYHGLQAGQGRNEALRQVQLTMLENAARRHPYYWASFIQSGEWANMKGRRDL